MKLRVKEARQEKGYKAYELAEGIKVTKQTISGIETGKFNPSINTLIDIADFLGVRITELFVDDKG